MTLKINGVTMPTPAINGFTCSENKIWSKNTGRTTGGKMVGTIIVIKRSVKITFPPLTEAQIATVKANTSSASLPFVSVEYTDAAGASQNITCYFADCVYPIYGTVNGVTMCVGHEIEGIEQ